MGTSIAVIGAGAKAAAIVARATVLKDNLRTRSAPTVHVFEKDHIGAAWSGDGDYSSGFLTLCTPGEKDVGFPYNERDIFGDVKEPTSPLLFRRFSWPAFLMATGRTREWVERGRDHPRHSEWARYLEWAFDQAGHEPIYEAVTGISRAGDRWRIEYGDGEAMEADGVVLTGAGRCRTVPELNRIPAGRILDARTFWPERQPILKRKNPVIAVAGDGGSAGAIIAWLSENLAESEARILSISRMGTLFPRGDGYAERRWFSDPSDWPELSLDDRRKLVERTEAGVISMRMKRTIDQANNVELLTGRVTGVRWRRGQGGSQGELSIASEYQKSKDEKASVTHPADYLVNAIGFDSWQMLDIVGHSPIELLLDRESEARRDELARHIKADLSLPERFDIPPGLHVPALAGLARGPGMGNLGCLGLVAAAIVDKYVR